MNPFIRELRDGDLEYLAEHLREVDKEEVCALHEDALEALTESVHFSDTVFIIDFSGVPAGIFGVSDYDATTDIIWLVGTDEITENSRLFLRYSREIIKALFEDSGKETFCNYTYAKNTVHHRWLRWCGALLGTVPVEIGPDRKEFLPFVIERNKHV